MSQRVSQRPYLLLTCGRWEQYHSRTDAPENPNYRNIVAVADYLSRLTVSICGADLKGPFEGHDMMETELAFLRRVVQPVARRMGLDLKLETRADIVILVNILMSSFDL